MINAIISIGVFLVLQLIAGVWWAAKIDTQVKALWRKYDEMK